MSFYANLSQWKKLDIKNETTVPNEMIFLRLVIKQNAAVNHGVNR